MSLYRLITNENLDYYPPLGQDPETGGLLWTTTKQTIKGRFGGGVMRYSTQEARDVIFDANFTSFSDLEEQGKIIYNGKGYLIADKFEIKKGNSAITSHYNYLLRNYDNSTV